MFKQTTNGLRETMAALAVSTDKYGHHDTATVIGIVVAVQLPAGIITIRLSLLIECVQISSDLKCVQLL